MQRVLVDDHSPTKFGYEDASQIRLADDDVRCDIALLAPADLNLSQTDQYDPNPRPRITLREWHLTASTEEPSLQQEFVSYYRPHREGDDDQPPQVTLTQLEGGYRVEIKSTDDTTTVLLPTDDDATIRSGQLSTTGELLVHTTGRAGEPQTVTAKLATK